jgi:hypothetical protein
LLSLLTSRRFRFRCLSAEASTSALQVCLFSLIWYLG